MRGNCDASNIASPRMNRSRLSHPVATDATGMSMSIEPRPRRGVVHELPRDVLEPAVRAEDAEVIDLEFGARLRGIDAVRRGLRARRRGRERREERDDEPHRATR